MRALCAPLSPYDVLCSLIAHLGLKVKGFTVTLLVCYNKVMRDKLRRTDHNIQRRCYDRNNPDFPGYGGRGITCSFTSATEFREHVLLHLGERPEGCSLDRVDNDKGYEPGNLRWATPKEQCNNRRERANKYGYPYLAKRGNSYMGRLRLNGNEITTKCYNNPVSAYLQVLSLRSFLHQ